MKKLLLALGFAPLALLGCGTDDPSGPEILPGLMVPAKPDNGVQIITPPFDNIQPGGDYEVCTWTDVVFDKNTDIRSTVGYQTEPPGHHVLLFWTTEKQPPGTQRVCTDSDMATFRYLTGNAMNGEVGEAPGDLVFKVPEGAQLVVNQHFLNAGDEVLRGQSAMNVNFAPPGNWRQSSAAVVLDTSIDVPQGESTTNIHCTYDRQYKLWYFIPHMHRWGKHIDVDLTLSGEKQRYFSVDWADQYTFHPPEKRFDVSAPLVINPGDSMDISCTWNNTESHSLPFGFEMCVAFTQFIDENGVGSWDCDKGNWGRF